jgi:hypothetical protein
MPRAHHWQLDPNYRTDPSGSRHGRFVPIAAELCGQQSPSASSGLRSQKLTTKHLTFHAVTRHHLQRHAATSFLYSFRRAISPSNQAKSFGNVR